VAKLVKGNRDGEEGYADSSVDEGRGADTQDACAREDKTVIARKLKWSVEALYRLGSKLAVMLGGGPGRKKA
jgi:hypothetical protein